jgi:methylglyoxal synthase
VIFLKTIALIAHDHKKQEIVAFAQANRDFLASHNLLATATTGLLIHEHTGLALTTYLSGPMGGDLQIGALIASGQVDLVIFLRDPLTAQPHEPDITALLRVCDVHNVPVATNEQCADMLLKALNLAIAGE